MSDAVSAPDGAPTEPGSTTATSTAAPAVHGATLTPSATTTATTIEGEVLRSFATIREMLRDRGVADLSSLDQVDDADVAAKAVGASVFVVDLPSCGVRVVYNLNAKFRTSDVKPLLTTQAPPTAKQFIVVVRERPVQGKGVEEMLRDVQMFLLRELQCNITRNALVPRHEPVRDEAEIEALLQRYTLRSRTQLPLILSSDPVARYLALRPGQLVRITRPSPSAGTYVTYRCCH